MRYLILGAGAIGGTLGARLFESGREVVLTARGAHLAALRAQGLRFRTPDATRVLPIPAIGEPSELELRPDDILLLTVKTRDTAALLDAWADRPVRGGGTAGERLPLICAQNGVENERLALRRFERVCGACVWLPATHLEPGEVLAYGAPWTGMLHLGRYPGGADPVLEPIAADLEASHVRAAVSDEVMRWKWAKLLSNLANAAQALCGEGDHLAPLVARIRSEGEMVLARAGIAYTSREEERQVRGKQVETSPIAGAERGGGSSWQSLKRRTGRIEADYLNGEIVLQGRLHGVPTPVNGVLQLFANQAAREGWEPGSRSVNQLEEAIAAARQGSNVDWTMPIPPK